ncbi:hypothetical protein P9112_009174 [Eukaryota sp. TZLM1-RC]
MPQFIDIGANLTDAMYQGSYHGKSYHSPDLDLVIQRSLSNAVNHIVVTAGTVDDTLEALQLCNNYSCLSTTIGIHPTRATHFLNSKTSLSSLTTLYHDNSSKISFLGELGLDYDRFQFSKKEDQHKVLEMQLTELAPLVPKPLFIHSRNSTDDMIEFITSHSDIFCSRKFVVHSFTDGIDAMKSFVAKGAYIGINGCSLRTQEGLNTVQELPLDKLILETDAPWCGIKRSHLGCDFVKSSFPVVKRNKYALDENTMVKDRNEPSCIRQVAEVVACVKDLSVEEVAETVYGNTRILLGMD